MDDLIVQCRNKKCTYWSNNPTILVTTLVMGARPLIHKQQYGLWDDKDSFLLPCESLA